MRPATMIPPTAWTLEAAPVKLVIGGEVLVPDGVMTPVPEGWTGEVALPAGGGICGGLEVDWWGGIDVVGLTGLTGVWLLKVERSVKFVVTLGKLK